MKTMRFKTNIKCNGCLSKVSPLLNSEIKIIHWSVDLDNDERTLTVESDDLSADDVSLLVLKSGFTAVEKTCD